MFKQLRASLWFHVSMLLMESCMISLLWLHWRSDYSRPIDGVVMWFRILARQSKLGQQKYSHRTREGRNKSGTSKSFSRGQTISLRKYKNQKTTYIKKHNKNNIVSVGGLWTPSIERFLVFVFSKTDCLTPAERLRHSWLIATLPRPVWV